MDTDIRSRHKPSHILLHTQALELSLRTMKQFFTVINVIASPFVYLVKPMHEHQSERLSEGIYIAGTSSRS